MEEFLLKFSFKFYEHARMKLTTDIRQQIKMKLK